MQIRRKYPLPTRGVLIKDKGVIAPVFGYRFQCVERGRRKVNGFRVSGIMQKRPATVFILMIIKLWPVDNGNNNHKYSATTAGHRTYLYILFILFCPPYRSHFDGFALKVYLRKVPHSSPVDLYLVYILHCIYRIKIHSILDIF